MNKSKLVLWTGAASIAAVMALSGCGGSNPEKQGKKAGKELCNCIKKTGNAEECHDKISKKYEKQSDSEKFLEGVFKGYEEAGCD